MSTLEDLESTLDDAKTKADELGESLNTATSDIDDTGVEELDSSLENASTSADDLNESLSGVDGSSMDDAAGSADNLAESLDEASGSADNLTGALESASYMGLAEGLGSYADGAENMAQEMNEAAISVGQLATQSGIAEDQMIGLINNISNATFPQEEAMQYVQALDQMGVSANQLGESATNMDRINDAFGIGSQNVVQLTNNLGVLGVSANQLDSSFNALAYAQSNITGGVDRFNTVLTRLGPAFSEYGYNVDQAAVITAAATQKWGTGRKSITELSQAMEAAGGDAAALEQALGLQPGAISNASAATAQYSGTLQQLANEEAEHKTWLDQINAAWEDFSLSLSPVLSPLMSLVGLFGQFGQFALAANSVVTLAQTLGILTTANEAATVSQMSLNLAFLTNPIFLVVAAIVALIAVLAYLYFNNETVRNAIDGLGQTVMAVAQIIWDSLVAAFEWLMEVWNNVVSAFTDGGDLITGVFTWLENTWQNVVAFFQQYGQLFLEALIIIFTGPIGLIALLIANFMGMPTQIGGALQNALSRIASWASSVVSNMTNAAVTAVSNFINGVSQLPGRVYNELSKTLSRVIEWGSQIVARLGEIAQKAWQAFVHGLGINSPGYIQILTLKELDDTGKRVPEVASRMITNLSKSAGNAVDAWGTPSFEYGFNARSEKFTPTGTSGGAGNNGNPGNNANVTYNFNLYGDMDNEDRMQKFIDAVVRELQWNNATAGRNMEVL